MVGGYFWGGVLGRGVVQHLGPGAGSVVVGQDDVVLAVAAAAAGPLSGARAPEAGPVQIVHPLKRSFLLQNTSLQNQLHQGFFFAVLAAT